MAENRPDHMKAINTTLTPPEEDLRGPDEDIPQAPVPQVVPIAERDAADKDIAEGRLDRSRNPDDRGNAAAERPGTRTP